MFSGCSPRTTRSLQQLKLILTAFNEEIFFLICRSNQYLSTFSRPFQVDPILTKKRKQRPQNAWTRATEAGRPGNFFTFNFILFQPRLYLFIFVFYTVFEPYVRHHFSCTSRQSPVCCGSIEIFQISSSWTAELSRKIITPMHQRQWFVKFHTFQMTFNTSEYVCILDDISTCVGSDLYIS